MVVGQEGKGEEVREREESENSRKREEKQDPSVDKVDRTGL